MQKEESNAQGMMSIGCADQREFNNRNLTIAGLGAWPQWPDNKTCVIIWIKIVSRMSCTIYVLFESNN